MKKYRCPHCGEKAFTSYRYNMIRLISDYYTFNFRDRYEIMRCPICGEKSKFSRPNKTLWMLEWIFSFIFILSAVLAVLVFTKNIIIGVALLVMSLLSLVFEILAKSSRVLVPCDDESTFYDVLRLPSNCRVEFNSIKYLKPYGMYAIKFKESTEDTRFKEAFTDGLVPIQLCVKIGDSLQFEARLIMKTAIPKELLYDGAKFLIEDSDGIFVAKGTFIKAYFEDELKENS